MVSSSLDPENLINTRDRTLGRGHGTRALGPSDTSDSGSDLLGAPGMAQQVGLGLGTGTTSDPEDSTAGNTAGPDVGDANLDSDTDSSGTGERAAASRDTVFVDGADIDMDRIEAISGDDEEAFSFEEDDDSIAFEEYDLLQNEGKRLGHDKSDRY